MSFFCFVSCCYLGKFSVFFELDEGLCGFALLAAGQHIDMMDVGLNLVLIMFGM